MNDLFKIVSKGMLMDKLVQIKDKYLKLKKIKMLDASEKLIKFVVV